MRRKKEMAILAGDTHSFHFLKVQVWLFHFVYECFQVVHTKTKNVTLKLEECFVSLLFKPIAGKNVSPSDKQLWRFLKMS